MFLKRIQISLVLIPATIGLLIGFMWLTIGAWFIFLPILMLFILSLWNVRSILNKQAGKSEPWYVLLFIVWSIIILNVFSAFVVPTV